MKDLRLKSNPYKQTAKEFGGLYLKEVVRRSWFVLLPLVLFWVGKFSYEIFKNPSFFQLIPIGVFTLVFFIVRQGFFRKLKSNPVFERERTLFVFDTYIELKEDLGAIRRFLFMDIHQVVASRKNYHVRLQTKQSFWIPKNCFKSLADQLEFECILRSKGKMK